MLHSLATDQGSDYRDNDPDLEPLVEIYQGYHANDEYEGAPRAESANYTVPVHGQYRPSGFYWNALAKGYKLGVQSSSDHVSTHSSYTLIYTPTTNRADIVESMRKRHAYGATDNIVLDFEARDAGGRQYMMGDAFGSSGSPKSTSKFSEPARSKSKSSRTVSSSIELSPMRTGRSSIISTAIRPELVLRARDSEGSQHGVVQPHLGEVHNAVT